MLSLMEIEVLKEIHGIEDALYIIFNEKEYVFKPIGIKEYDEVCMLSADEYELEDNICQTTCIYPYKDNGEDEINIIFSDCEYAGLPHFASKKILEFSGINNPNMISEKMHSKKLEMYNFTEMCINVVKAVFTEYKLEEIQRWSWNKLSEMAVRAEFILNLKGIDVELQPPPFVDKESESFNDEEYIKKMRSEAKSFNKMGIDPMVRYSSEFVDCYNGDLKYPVITNVNSWREEDELNAIRTQINKKPT